MKYHFDKFYLGLHPSFKNYFGQMCFFIDFKNLDSRNKNFVLPPEQTLRSCRKESSSGRGARRVILVLWDLHGDVEDPLHFHFRGIPPNRSKNIALNSKYTEESRH
jgi:hypothetical protein